MREEWLRPTSEKGNKALPHSARRVQRQSHPLIHRSRICCLVLCGDAYTQAEKCQKLTQDTTRMVATAAVLARPEPNSHWTSSARASSAYIKAWYTGTQHTHVCGVQ